MLLAGDWKHTTSAGAHAAAPSSSDLLYIRTRYTELTDYLADANVLVLYSVVLVLLCLEVESLIVTLQRGVIQGYEMSEPYAEAMVPITATGQISFYIKLEYAYSAAHMQSVKLPSSWQVYFAKLEVKHIQTKCVNITN